MKITFVLPMYLDTPSGGFKVVYEYANRLSSLGHQVTVVHPRSVEAQRGFTQTIKQRLWEPKLRLTHRPLISWFQVRSEVTLSLVLDLREGNIPDADVIFATACETAFPVASYSAAKGRKFYLTQSYETWKQSEETVMASWKLPMRKIVVSRHLFEIAARLEEQNQTSHIPIGIDFSDFNLLIPIASRELRVGMLAHPNQAKGAQDGARALEIVKQNFPELQVVMFGTEARLPLIPDWVDYERRPTKTRLAELYNECRIFLNPSWTEGWGLTSAEAMACGCALVTTDNGGASEFAVDNETALMAPIQQPELLADKLLKLLRDDSLRQQIALSGYQSIQQFTWERAVNSLLGAISNV
ncbi:MAG: glycosyltransferase family 4 protein [Blastocatellia bacterium]